MKKVLAVMLVVFVLMLALVSCTGGGQTTTTTTTNQDPPVEPPVDVHEHSYTAVVTEPTCTEKGYSTYTCECGDSYIDNYVDAKGHFFGSWEETKAPSCTEKGKYVRTCECGAVEYRDVAPVEHSYSTNVTNPTCTERGYTTYTCKCGDTYTDNYTDALGHDKVPHNSQAPTCTEVGWEAYETCTRCDYTTYVELAITEHTPGDWIIDKAATLTAEGLKHKECSQCGKTVETSIIPKKTHSYKSTVTAPTCTEQGYTTHKCSECGDTYVDDYIPALGHNMGSWTQIKAPTCTTEGTERRDCSRCDHYETRAIEKVSHTYTSVVTKPTCTEKGYTTYVCACGDTYKDTYISAIGHKCGEWYVLEAPTCTTEGTERRDCQNETCDYSEFASIAPIAHDYSYSISVEEPTCINEGWTTYACICGDYYNSDYKNQLGHDLSVMPAVEATCAKPGLTAYVYCTRCDVSDDRGETVYAVGHNYGEWVIIKAPTLTEAGLKESTCACGLKHTRSFGYHGNYGYDSLASMINGSKMQALYNEMDKIVVEFHSNASLNAENNVVGIFNYNNFGLTSNEAIAVWKVYKNDHPLYYWISNTVNYDNTNLFLLADNMYALGSDRVEYNRIVNDGIKEYAELVAKNEGSPYLIALAFHDKIILSTEYAYESDGVTPANDAWAHNILGVFEKKTGVCEAYAKTFQLLLNYCGIENIYVTGYTTEPHVWNLVKMDDGNWYWFDLTLDDTSDNAPRWAWGIRYNYFCVNDTWDNHTPETPLGTGVNFLYTLPERSENETIKKQFYYLTDWNQILPDYKHNIVVDDIEYQVVGYNVVEVVDTNHSVARIDIPETITYNGRTYTVISIRNAGHEMHEATSVTIPKTIKFIWDSAVLFPSVEKFIVDEDNPYFTSNDGVLFTKSLYTLIAYPLANSRTEYVIPDEVTQIAYTAFGHKFSDELHLKCKNLSTLVIGHNFSGSVYDHLGYGYKNEKEFVIFDPRAYIVGGMVYLHNSLCSDKSIVIPKNHPDLYLSQDGKILYCGSWIMCVFDQTVTSLHIPKGITEGLESVIEELPYLETITVDPDHEALFVYDRLLYYRHPTEGYVELAGVPKSIKGTVTIYNECTTIGSFMEGDQLWGGGADFAGCSLLTSVIIPSSVTNIGAGAFSDCTDLTDIVIPDSCITILDRAFSGCTSLTNIVLPNSTIFVGPNNGYHVFSGCTSLKNVTLSNVVKDIPNATFFGCSSLTSITISNSVTSIGDAAFWECDSLSTIIFEGTLTEWNAISKGSNWNYNTGFYTIYCTDGTIAKDGTITYN